MLTVLSKNIHTFSTTQISVPLDIADKIKKWGKDNIPESAIKTVDGVGRETNIHITVKYGLHTNNYQDVKDVVQNFGEIKIKLGSVSKFDNDDYDVLKINVLSNDLKRLNKLISDNLDHTDTHSTYSPHITVAYVKKNSCNDLIGNTQFSNIGWTASEIKFSSKTNHRHKISIK